ncbi:MAG TPA: RsmD family RNA methyltransferase [Holophaga sp.]|nr:RsmD family RNA methyltransferase [Holophaga sp.]
MRIIAGTLWGRRLQGPEAGDLSVRPTSDRAREALFSILQKWPAGAFLDLFGGTGAVAVEAWSRGYGPVVCVERSREALALIEANVRGTDVRVLRQDVRKLRLQALGPQALIFADPPYDASAGLWTELAPALQASLLPEGVLVWETGRREELPACPGLTCLEAREYGAACFHFFQRCPSP